MKKALIAALAALALASAALGQQLPFPNPMPPRTVVCNPLPQAAQGQACAYSVLQAALLYGETPISDANYAQTAADSLIVYNTLTATRTVTLLPAANFSVGFRFYIMDRSGAAAPPKSINVTPTGADTINGANTSLQAITSPYLLVTVESDGVSKWTVSLNPSSTGLSTYNVRAFGAKCDGATDDTTALQNLGNTIFAAGGNALIVFPAGATCLTFNSGQTFVGNLGLLFNFGNSPGVSNVYVQGNGATITNNHTFSTSEVLYNFYCGTCVNFYIDNLKFVQTNGVVLPATTPYGTVGLWAFNGSSNIFVTNVSMTGGEVPAMYSSGPSAGITQRIIEENVSSTNSVYGVLTTNGGSGSAQVKHLFVRGLTVDSTHDRAVFLKDVTNADISVTSQNAGANDVLIASDTSGGIDENIKLNYRVLARTSGTPVSYITIGNSQACTTSCANSIYRNISVNIDADLSGDATAVPVVQFIKSTTSSLGLTFENIKFTGKVSGVPNASGNLFDLFHAADASWSGETATNISFDDMVVTGSATPTFYIDYAPFSASVNGGFGLRNFSMPGNYTDANSTNVHKIRFAANAQFGNTIPVVDPSFGGTGQFQPTAHSFMLAEGASPFNLLSLLTGQVPIGVTSNDPVATLFPIPPPMGRLTLQTATPVMTTSQTAKTTIFYDCYLGRMVPYFDGTKDQMDGIPSCEVSTAMQASSTGVINSGDMFDVWYVQTGANRICVATNGSGGGWASDTGGSTTARGTGYSQLDNSTRGFTTNKNALTHCYNASTDYGSVSANQATYLGSFFSSAAGTTTWNLGSAASGGGIGQLYLWNAYNKVDVAALVTDSGTSYTYSTLTIREARASTTNQVSIASGRNEGSVHCTVRMRIQTAAVASAFGFWGCGLDSTTTFWNSSGSFAVAPTANSFQAAFPSHTAGLIGIGLHTLSMNEEGDGSNANTFDVSSDNQLTVDLRM